MFFQYIEKKNRANRDENLSSHSPTSIDSNNKVPNQAPILPPKQTENTEDETIPSWRRSGSFRNRIQDPDAANSVSSGKFSFIYSKSRFRHKKYISCKTFTKIFNYDTETWKLCRKRGEGKDDVEITGYTKQSQHRTGSRSTTNAQFRDGWKVSMLEFRLVTFS